MNIPVVVAAYNRDAALVRLLGSLRKARYDGPVKLIICIDGGGPPEVVKTAEQFVWDYGEKQVIVQEKNLGLRKHILFCGELSSQYDGTILLEDDLYVSPWFYRYAQSAALHYRESHEICGIALYSLRYNESAHLPFYPLNDGMDVFYMQIACSWGQLWLKRQWEEFASWYSENETVGLGNDPALPFVIRQWPETSWKKYFIKFMIESDKYFVYPRQSFTTNFGDVGIHHTGTLLFQVPLLYGKEKIFNFNNFAESHVKYDVFGELLPESMQELCPELRQSEFVVDLYGMKEKHCFTKEYVLTSKKCNDSARTYGRYLKPIECNVIENMPGDDLYMTSPDSIYDIKETDFREYIYSNCSDVEKIKYYYNITDIHYIALHRQINKCKSEINSYRHDLNKHKEWLSKSENRVHALNERLDKKGVELVDMRKKLADAQKSIDLLRNSTSYKIGNAIVLPLSRLRGKRKT